MLLDYTAKICFSAFFALGFPLGTMVFKWVAEDCIFNYLQWLEAWGFFVAGLAILLLGFCALREYSDK